MSKDQSAGVATLGLILSRMATGEPLSVGALVADGGVARSTAFAVVKRMVEAGLVSKQPDGHLVPGTAAGAFAYAASNLAPLHGRAAPILTWLRDQTNAGVELQACHGATYQTLARFSASPGSEKPSGKPLLFTVRRADKEAAILRMFCTEASIEEATCRTLAAEAVSRLEHMLAVEQA
ncbi:MAG: hypothetical protein JWP26_1074 [Devosia sp.]|uniref:MarR family transcriptional regulator n=1 Tax=Devosia sp. TaxID=1871048 RepID=UPI00261C671F|nr:helix-turn-helix domain-containing protein [Devosia sp.]MDB5586104.1 hypothetical protein [Devosia sp.]